VPDAFVGLQVCFDSLARSEASCLRRVYERAVRVIQPEPDQESESERSRIPTAGLTLCGSTLCGDLGSSPAASPGLSRARRARVNTAAKHARFIRWHPDAYPALVT
jgi:hypothetical protein